MTDSTSTSESSQPHQPSNYGDIGESFIEKVCCVAFIEDFVFRSPKYRRGAQEKELCDILILFDDSCVLIEVKTADPIAHRGWTMEEEVRWANAQIRTASKQLQGAFAALCKGLVPSVENQFVGKIDLRLSPPKKFYAIAAVDHRPLIQAGHVTDLVSGSLRCPVVQLSFSEFTEALHELASIPDLLDYLHFRQRYLERSTFEGCTELDLVAAFKSQYPLIDEAIRSGRTIHLANDVWQKYSQMNRRRTRDEERIPSNIVDRVIRDMRLGVRLTDETAEVVPRPPGQEIDNGVKYAITRLNSLRRIERATIGNSLIAKSKLCDTTGRGRWFAHIADTGWLYFWYISNEDRVNRRKMLTNLTNLAQIANTRCNAIGVAMNSFTGTGTKMSIDLITIQFPQDFDWSQCSSSDRELALKVFKPAVEGLLMEYRPWNNKPGFKRFKERRK